MITCFNKQVSSKKSSTGTIQPPTSIHYLGRWFSDCVLGSVAVDMGRLGSRGVGDGVVGREIVERESDLPISIPPAASLLYLMLVYSRPSCRLLCSAEMRCCTVSMWCWTARYTNLYWASVCTIPDLWDRTICIVRWISISQSRPENTLSR